jgi:serine/threonine protein kinase
MKLNPGEKATEVCGTTSYMAPEVLHGNYGVECDVWSLGVICYFMLSGTLPFPGKNDDEKEQRILAGEYPTDGRHWAHVSKDGVNFVRAMLVANPKKRLGTQQPRPRHHTTRAPHATDGTRCTRDAPIPSPPTPGGTRS